MRLKEDLHLMLRLCLFDCNASQLNIGRKGVHSKAFECLIFNNLESAIHAQLITRQTQI
jgi:hypothetical protein